MNSCKSNAFARDKVDSSNEDIDDQTEFDEDGETNLASVITLSLECSRCREVFKDRYDLNVHLYETHQIHQYRCPVKGCLASFEYMKQVFRHRKTEHQELGNSWPCAKCLFTSISYKMLIVHNWIRHQRGHYKCGFEGCNFESNTYRVKIKNHQDVHRLKKFRCTFKDCEKAFIAEQYLIQHQRVHTGDKPFKCPQCDLSFNAISNFNRHRKFVHEGLKPYSCKWPKCKYASGHKSAVQSHVKRMHLKNEEKRDPNDFIEKHVEMLTSQIQSEFQNYNPELDSNLQQSTANVSTKISKNAQTEKRKTNEKPQEISKKDNKRENRNKSSDNEEEMEQEQNESLRAVTLRLNCIIKGCKVKCPDKFAQNAHILEAHQIEQYRCLVPNCAESFKHIKQFYQHKKAYHKDLRNFDCFKCDYTSNTYKKLFSHHHTQHEKGRFGCSFSGCNFVSRTRQRINYHIYVHRLSKTKCPIEGCENILNSNQKLKMHLKTHSKHSKPLNCPRCERIFVQASDYNKHLEKKHRLVMTGYRCKWPECLYSAATGNAVRKHIRKGHFSASDNENVNRNPKKLNTNKKRMTPCAYKRETREFIENIYSKKPKKGLIS